MRLFNANATRWASYWTCGFELARGGWGGGGRVVARLQLVCKLAPIPPLLVMSAAWWVLDHDISSLNGLEYSVRLDYFDWWYMCGHESHFPRCNFSCSLPPHCVCDIPSLKLGSIVVFSTLRSKLWRDTWRLLSVLPLVSQYLGVNVDVACSFPYSR